MSGTLMFCLGTMTLPCDPTASLPGVGLVAPDDLHHMGGEGGIAVLVEQPSAPPPAFTSSMTASITPSAVVHPPELVDRGGTPGLPSVCLGTAPAVSYGAMSDKFVTLPEIRKHAKKVLPRDVWNFGDGGAETETTLRRNRRA